MITQQLINGFTLGVIYSLLALGYSLIFGVLDFINFAHGEVSLFGGYLTWYLFKVKEFPFLFSCLVGILAAAIIGVLMERIAYKPIREAPRLSMIIASVGFGQIVRMSVQILFGTEPQEFSLSNVSVYKLFGVSVTSINIAVLIISAILMILLQIFIMYTKEGRSIRAISQDKDTASLMGINVNLSISKTFAIGSALGAISGIMLAVYYSQIYPMMGMSVSNKAFAAVVLGGAGSVPGAMLGGIIMGLIESIAATFLNAQLREGVSFLVMIIILIFKPSGLLGKEVLKR